MQSNTILRNVQHNRVSVNRLMQQIYTQRLISNPSENPLIAARALRFETALNQVEQHQRNVVQGTTWATSTATAVSAFEDIMERLTELSQQIDGIESIADTNAISREISELIIEMQNIMNTNFTGRYLFSGFRTDQPAFFKHDRDDLVVEITQTFTARDLESTLALDRSQIDLTQSPPVGGRVATIHRVNLAFTGNEGSVTISPSTIPLQSVPRIEDGPNAGEIDYGAMSDNGIYHDPETGQILFQSRPQSYVFPLQITYTQSGFAQGDINPMVYFPVTVMERELDENGDPMYDADGNPIFVAGDSFNMDNQNMEFEFGINSRMPVNLLAKNVFPAAIFADLRAFARDLEHMQNTATTRAELELAGLSEDEIIEFMQREQAMVDTTILTNRFNNLVQRVSHFAEDVSVQHTDLGVRMRRLEIIEERLELDALNFEELFANNIGTDMYAAMNRLAAANVAYMAAMQMGLHNIVNMTLLNFL